MLIPSDTYDGLICSACVEGNQYLREQRGKAGWMTIVPDGEAYRVIGRLEAKPDDAATENGVKRERTEEADGQNKRVKLDEVSGGDTSSAKLEEAEVKRPGKDETVKEANDIGQTVTTAAEVPKGKGDVFLADGIREKLQAELDVRPSIRTLLTSGRDDCKPSIRPSRQRNLRAPTR